MTLLDIKKRSLELIEEIKSTIEAPTSGQTEVTDDPDIETKINGVVNQIQFELAQIKRIGAKETYTVTSDEHSFNLPDDFYQANKVKECEYEILEDKTIEFDSGYTGTVNFYYYKFPTIINDETSDDSELEVSLDCQNAMPYGITSDLLKADVSVDYKIYRDRYNELKNQLRLSTSSPMATVVNLDGYTYS